MPNIQTNINLSVAIYYRILYVCMNKCTQNSVDMPGVSAIQELNV